MSIASIAKKAAARIADPTARQIEELAVRETLSSAYQSAVKAYGTTAASAWMEATHGEPPATAETEAAELSIARENLADLRAANPFEGARAALSNPAVAYSGPDTRTAELRAAQRLPIETDATVADPFAVARARIAAEAPEANAARDAWAHAGNHMTQDQFGGDTK